MAIAYFAFIFLIFAVAAKCPYANQDLPFRHPLLRLNGSVPRGIGPFFLRARAVSIAVAHAKNHWRGSRRQNRQRCEITEDRAPRPRGRSPPCPFTLLFNRSWMISTSRQSRRIRPILTIFRPSLPSQMVMPVGKQPLRLLATPCIRANALRKTDVRQGCNMPPYRRRSRSLSAGNEWDRAAGADGRAPDESRRQAGHWSRVCARLADRHHGRTSCRSDSP